MKRLILILCIGITAFQLSATIIPARLRCEYLENPPVIDVPAPRLSWVNTAGPGERGPSRGGRRAGQSAIRRHPAKSRTRNTSESL